MSGDPTARNHGTLRGLTGDDLPLCKHTHPHSHPLPIPSSPVHLSSYSELQCPGGGASQALQLRREDRPPCSGWTASFLKQDSFFPTPSHFPVFTLDLPSPGEFFLIQACCKGNPHYLDNLSAGPMTSFPAKAAPVLPYSFQPSM